MHVLPYAKLFTTYHAQCTLLGFHAIFFGFLFYSFIVFYSLEHRKWTRCRMVCLQCVLQGEDQLFNSIAYSVLQGVDQL